MDADRIAQKTMPRKPLNKISIREITDGCGVNRQTFCCPFEDICGQMSDQAQAGGKTGL